MKEFSLPLEAWKEKSSKYKLIVVTNICNAVFVKVDIAQRISSNLFIINKRKPLVIKIKKEKLNLKHGRPWPAGRSTQGAK